jgi:hypothetical protein
MKKSLLALFMLLLPAAGQPSYKFDFGHGEPLPGHINVAPATPYTEDLGYGFEPGLIDLNAMSKPFYEAHQAFQAIKDNKLPIATYLIGTPSFDLAANFDVPTEPTGN